MNIKIPPRLRVGYHVSKSKGLYKNIQPLIQEGGLAVQCFLSPKEGFHPGIPLTDSDVQSILDLKIQKDLYTVVHGKYILNFARPGTVDQTGKGNPGWQRQALVNDLTQANRIGANVIIHQGKNVKDLNYTTKQALEHFVENIVAVLDTTELAGVMNKIILENSCQQGTELGYTVEELAEIYHMFSTKYQERISFCLDLCHVHVAGTLDVCQDVEVNKFFEKFDKLIGLKKLEVIHFNDSKVRFDGHNDSHEDILAGYIGNDKIVGNPGSYLGFKRIVELAEEMDIPLILETPSLNPDKNPNGIPYKDQIELLKSWSKVTPHPEYMAEYQKKHQIKIMEFVANPTSTKGRKKQPKTTPKTTPNPTQTKTKITPKLTQTKITPKLTQIKPKVIKKILPMDLDPQHITTPTPKILIKKK